MENKNNYSDTLLDDYDLFGQVYPYNKELQAAVAESLKNYFSKNADGGHGLYFLEIGVGSGNTTKAVASVFPNAKYILNEFDAKLLNKAEDFLACIDNEKKIGDIEKIIKQMPDKSVDAVYTAWVIHNFSPVKRSTLFREIARVLKEDGVFVYMEKVQNVGVKRRDNLAQNMIAMAPFANKYDRSDLFIEHIKHYLRDEEPDIVFTDDENEKLLSKNGFSWEYVKQILLEKVIIATKKKGHF